MSQLMRALSQLNSLYWQQRLEELQRQHAERTKKQELTNEQKED